MAAAKSAIIVHVFTQAANIHIFRQETHMHAFNVHAGNCKCRQNACG